MFLDQGFLPQNLRFELNHLIRMTDHCMIIIVAEREPRWVFRVNIVSLGTEKEIGTVYVCTDLYVCMYCNVRRLWPQNYIVYLST